jgi:signal transduction histidine kinase
MDQRNARRLAWALLVICIVVTGVTAVLFAWNGLDRQLNGVGSRALDLALFVLFLAFPIVGALVASRVPGNLIGWLMLGMGVWASFLGLTTEYTNLGLQHPGSVPGPDWSAWYASAAWFPLVYALTVTLVIFPDGRAPSWRWRLFLQAAGVAIVLGFFVVGGLTKGPLLAPFDHIQNPAGIIGPSALTNDARGMGWLMFVASVPVAAAAVLQRFRRSSGDTRLQLKWLALGASLLAVGLVVSGTLPDLYANPQTSPPALLGSFLAVVGLIAIPVSIGMAILRYRLYDIDIVINKAVVYGLLAVFITLVYVTVVVGVGAVAGSRADPVLSAIAAAVVALAFQPVRRRVQRLANHLVYGKRATPYEVLSDFSDRLSETYSIDEVLPRMARLISDGTGADSVAVWLSGRDAFRQVASWPTSPAGVEVASLPGRVFEIRHRGEQLGALTVQMPPSEPITTEQDRLVADVASQAGLVLRNAALIAELQGSRRRIVAAQDDERRRIERNIHDGAQQQLVALAVKERLLANLIRPDDERAMTIAEQLQAETIEALENLRDLARGIYPPLLADRGLSAALGAQARKSPIPVVVDADGVGRFPQEIETAVYFSVLEALQNVAKYADASQAQVGLSLDDGTLVFEVADDGVGFDPSSTGYGTGLQGMTDRVEAIGGALSVRSVPGAGTWVTGRVPLLAGPFAPGAEPDGRVGGVEPRRPADSKERAHSAVAHAERVHGPSP